MADDDVVCDALWRARRIDHLLRWNLVYVSAAGARVDAMVPFFIGIGRSRQSPVARPAGDVRGRVSTAQIP
jgi:hypothetical protein